MLYETGYYRGRLDVGRDSVEYRSGWGYSRDLFHFCEQRRACPSEHCSERRHRSKTSASTVGASDVQRPAEEPKHNYGHMDDNNSKGNDVRELLGEDDDEKKQSL